MLGRGGFGRDASFLDTDPVWEKPAVHPNNGSAWKVERKGAARPGAGLPTTAAAPGKTFRLSLPL
jgi:hypothetical protein